MAQPILNRPEKTSNLSPAAITPKQAEHTSVQLAIHLGRKYRDGKGGVDMDHSEKIKGFFVCKYGLGYCKVEGKSLKNKQDSHSK